MGSAVVRVIRAASERTPTPDGPVVCVYKIPGPYGSVVVSVEPDGTDRFTTALNENPRDADTIDRLGDEAFAGGMASVWVRVDEGFFVVGVQRNPGPDAVQDLRTLAGAALDNIPARQ